MNKEQLQKVWDALAVATTPLAKDRQTVIAAIAILDAALAAEPQRPVAYRQKVQFYATEIWCYFEERRTGYNEPLYTAPVAAQQVKLKGA